MIINSYEEKLGDSAVTISAIIEWEDADRPTQEIFFEVGADRDYLLPENYHPFLLAAVVPALRSGEQRIKVAGSVSAWLCDNLSTLMHYLDNWFPSTHNRVPGSLVRIEASGHDHNADADGRRERRTASFFSGGVDSFETLYRNRKLFPLDHPASIKDGLFVHGFDIGLRPKRGDERDIFAHCLEKFEAMKNETKLNIIPVWTNLRALDLSTDCWRDEFQGVAMGAVAQVLSGKLTDVLIASSNNIPNLLPWGTHPLLDYHMSTYGLRVNHDGERYGRLEKVRSICQWPAALENLRVCFFGEAGKLNCGQCEKCIYTMLQLLAVNKLHEAPSFAANDVTAAEVEKYVKASAEFIDETLRPLAKDLERVHRSDLSRVIKRKILRYRLTRYLDIIGIIKTCDDRVFRGRIKSFVIPLRKRLGLGRNKRPRLPLSHN